MDITTPEHTRLPDDGISLDKLTMPDGQWQTFLILMYIHGA